MSSALSNQNIRNCLGVTKNIINLFRNNALTGEILRKAIVEHTPETKKTCLVGLCDTRFIEQHDAVNVFVKIF